MKIIVANYDSYVSRKFTSYLLSKGCEVIAIKCGKSTESTPDNLTVINQDKAAQTLKSSKADAAFYFPQDNRVGTDKDSVQTNYFDFFDIAKNLSIKHFICLESVIDGECPHFYKDSRATRPDNYSFAITYFKTDFIIGSGSPSFEAIRNVVEKLPVMIVPKWIKAPCNPIAIDDLLENLYSAINNENYFNKSFTIGTNDTISLGKMMLLYSKNRGMLRLLISMPLPVIKLSAFLLRIFAKTPKYRSLNLVKKLKSRHKNRKKHKTPDINTQHNYTESLKLTLGFTSALKLRKKTLDQLSTPVASYAFEGYYGTPVYGCSHIKLEKEIEKKDADRIINKINNIGYDNRWYLIDWLWHFKGWTNWLIFTKKEQSNKNEINRGDKLDFWKAQIADEKNLHILLFADLFMPGEGWLEFRIIPYKNKLIYRQTLIFRPLGFTGRLYWFWTKPLHYFLLKRILKNLTVK